MLLLNYACILKSLSEQELTLLRWSGRVKWLNLLCGNKLLKAAGYSLTNNRIHVSALAACPLFIWMCKPFSPCRNLTNMTDCRLQAMVCNCSLRLLSDVTGVLSEVSLIFVYLVVLEVSFICCISHMKMVC